MSRPEVRARSLQGKETLRQVKPLSTGIKLIDNLGALEVTWYTRQLHRLARGREPKPNEHALKSLLLDLPQKGLDTVRSRRLRA